MSTARMQPVPLNELWRNEVEFTKWLETNIDLLADAVGLVLTPLEREKRAGVFQADLIAEDEDGRLIVIENQLERTNHGHLGQLVTYLSNLDAKIAIWICTEARPEHLRAVEWLNEITPDDVGFYVLKLEAYRIEDSPPAPLFVKLIGPTSTGKEIGATRKELAGIQLLRKEFWEFLLARARRKGVTLHSGGSPTTDNWLGTSAGRSGLSFNYHIRLQDSPGTYLKIDTGDETKNREIFEHLYGKNQEIERAFGSELI